MIKNTNPIIFQYTRKVKRYRKIRLKNLQKNWVDIGKNKRYNRLLSFLYKEEENETT